MIETSLVIGIGSNVTDREFKVTKAIEALCGAFRKANVSAVYESAPFSGQGEQYVNAVFAGVTNMSMTDVIEFLKQTEAEAGRNSISSLEGQVELDLDLVIWDGRIVRPKDFERPYFNVGYRQLLADGAFQYNV